MSEDININFDKRKIEKDKKKIEPNNVKKSIYDSVLHIYFLFRL